jgi:hypothetical protein
LPGRLAGPVGRAHGLLVRDGASSWTVLEQNLKCWERLHSNPHVPRRCGVGTSSHSHSHVPRRCGVATSSHSHPHVPRRCGVGTSSWHVITRFHLSFLAISSRGVDGWYARPECAWTQLRAGCGGRDSLALLHPRRCGVRERVGVKQGRHREAGMFVVFLLVLRVLVRFCISALTASRHRHLLPLRADSSDRPAVARRRQSTEREKWGCHALGPSLTSSHILSHPLTSSHIFSHPLTG